MVLIEMLRTDEKCFQKYNFSTSVNPEKLSERLVIARIDTVFRKLSLSLYGLKFRELSLILNSRRPFIRHSQNK